MKDQNYCKKCDILLPDRNQDICDLCMIPDEEVSPQKTLPWLFPRYDETVLFAMAVSSMLLFLSNDGARIFLWKVLDSGLEGLVGLGIFFSGLLLSIFHGFAKRKKTNFEKHLIICFAVFMNGFSGWVGGVYYIEKASGLWSVFPAINILNSGLLLLFLRFSLIDERNVSDENADVPQILLSGLTVVVVYVACEFVFAHPWFTTFSICVFYATNLSVPLFQFFRVPKSRLARGE